MDYVVGGVAALISGNVTPNRPKIVRKALTPIKHQPSPNVTPKSEFVDDRSIFLSPSVQKKKAIVKKSPKRIFQNPDLDEACEGEIKSSPNADKVKKHLRDDLEEKSLPHSSPSAKSPKKNKSKSGKSQENSATEEIESPQSANENTPKKKKNRNSTTEDTFTDVSDAAIKTPKAKKKRELNLSQLEQENEEEKETKNNENLDSSENVNNPKKKNKRKVKLNTEIDLKAEINEEIEDTKVEIKKSNKKKLQTDSQNIGIKTGKNESKKSKKKDKKSTFVNPNAITNKDTDSEHESDDEILSENEEVNKEILDTGPADDSSDEDEKEEKKVKKVEPQEKPAEERTDDEIKRTLFVGNVPFNKKCKKEIKRIFSKHGAIETVRIRTVPVKDARVTPKLAVIRNELHPERTTVNVYVKFKDISSVEQALSENNTLLEGCHLRVSRSDATGAEHDPRCAVFVGNMPFALEDDALREKFAKCGEIVSVRIIRDKKTNAGKGFGYVNFASKDGVELALALPEEDLTIKNRIMRVKRCTQLTQKQQNHGDNKNFKNQDRNQGMRSKSQGMRGRNQGMQGRNQSMQGGNQGMQGRNQGMQGKFSGKGPKQWGQKQGDMPEGAQRRLMNKRKSQDNDGPDEKKPKYLNQPQKDKKVRKEFVGMTAEKKKKHTFNKGQKKKKALSEILTK